ncbi:hypothetical protein MtrunA17_Chr6g0479881 [Medicago truncatula]|uniref:Uncharacterized protein n=1 Tax=Medicago truncatula TaxID=3880 RepID=A0A396HGB3_MEDTR|nr:hypothetical protein MtrunA17_Chr6g0479881 [Medicago truncatula]
MQRLPPLSSPADNNFPARWPVVAPPRRSFKLLFFKKKNTVSKILFRSKPKSGLRISKASSYKSRSRNKDSKKNAKNYLYFLSPVRGSLSGSWSGFLRFVAPSSDSV